MDSIDIKILRTVQAEPGLSVQDLADRVGLSHTPCWRRLKKLEASGAIVERATILNPDALGLSITVYANIRLKQHDEATLEAFERATLECPEIVECFSMSGESDYVLRIVTGSVAQYEAFLKKVLLHLPGVATVNSSFALKCVKLTTKLPI
ncbi:MAG: Lrp/AsnC family transcriptional regulator [Alphaproteobacteria bacterium]|nr:MAG: Lrp/AsnC family transcriptional regulator [Alphaproteobacteria bacterium]